MLCVLHPLARAFSVHSFMKFGTEVYKYTRVYSNRTCDIKWQISRCTLYIAKYVTLCHMSGLSGWKGTSSEPLISQNWSLCVLSCLLSGLCGWEGNNFQLFMPEVWPRMHTSFIFSMCILPYRLLCPVYVRESVHGFFALEQFAVRKNVCFG